MLGTLFTSRPFPLVGGPTGPELIPRGVNRYDPHFGGPYTLPGTVAIAGTPDIPAQRLVALMDERTKMLVRTMRSDPVTGAYEFRRVAYGPWTIISWDHTGEYNAVVASARFGDPM